MDNGKLLLLSSIVIAGCPGAGGSHVCPAGEVAHADECTSASPIEPDDDERSMADAGDAAMHDDGEHDLAPALDAGPVPANDVDAAQPCVPSAEPDLPDTQHIDSNCDGIDGDSRRSVFVSANGDDAAEGTLSAPVRTIAHAIARAAELELGAVLVADGTYEEALSLVNGVSIYGGYASDTWAREASVMPVLRAAGPVITGRDIDQRTLLSTLRIEAQDAAQGASSVGVLLVRASGVELEDVEVIAGRGGDGASPLPPTSIGYSGTNGISGRSGYKVYPNLNCEGTPKESPVIAWGNSICGGKGGNGGAAGGYKTRTSTLTTATAGEAGGVPAGSKAAAAVGGFVGGDGSSAASGSRGEDGEQGVAGPSGGSLGGFYEGGYVPADGMPGAQGIAGGGGGGGGGTKGCIDNSPCGWVAGAGGGAGGAGGCGGEGGHAGTGGGASIAVLLWNSKPLLRRVELEASDGGLGGNGTRGGAGGEGGAGGAANDEYWECEGSLKSGRGGNGGQGGQGGGGGGGPSFALVFAGGSVPHPDSQNITLMSGEGGDGGLGGDGATNGEIGLSSDSYTVGQSP